MKRWKSSRTARWGSFFAVFVVFVIGLAVFVNQASERKKEPEQSGQEKRTDLLEDTDRLVSQVGFGEKEPVVVETSKEIVKDTVISGVPRADYSYSFNGKLENALTVTRQGDVGGFNAGTYPQADDSVTAKFTDGVEGSALYLDGSYGIELTGIEGLADSYTISFWFKAAELRDWSPFIAISSDMLNENGSENYISFNKKTNEDGETVTPVFNTVNANLNNSCEIRPCQEDKDWLKLNEWNYITVRVDASQTDAEDDSKVMGYLYLNSEMIGSAPVSRMNLEEGNIKAYVGINCFDELFEACYDEIRIWNTLLDENQISALYVAYQK